MKIRSGLYLSENIFRLKRFRFRPSQFQVIEVSCRFAPVSTGLSDCSSLNDDDYEVAVVVQGHGRQLHKVPLRDQKQTHLKKSKRLTLRGEEHFVQNALVEKVLWLKYDILKVGLQYGWYA